VENQRDLRCDSCPLAGRCEDFGATRREGRACCLLGAFGGAEGTRPIEPGTKIAERCGPGVLGLFVTFVAVPEEVEGRPGYNAKAVAHPKLAPSWYELVV